MSIATEMARLQQAKADLKASINAKGGNITDETIDEYAGFVDVLEVGGAELPSTAGGSIFTGATIPLTIKTILTITKTITSINQQRTISQLQDLMVEQLLQVMELKMFLSRLMLLLLQLH
jgi:hypothetical protein